MNQYEIEAMEASANFLYDNKISRNFLWEVLKKSIDAKRNLCELIGLSEEHGYKVEIPLVGEAEDEFTMFVDYLCKALNSRDNGKEAGSAAWKRLDKMFVQDVKKNKYKVTKVLNRSLFGGMLILANIKDRGILRTMASGGSRCCHDLCCTECVDNFVKWYGEQVKGDRKIILSANPVDILMASMNASFTSCYQPFGACFNGTIASMLSKDVLIAHVEENNRPGYKVGRSWVYVNNDLIICARKYGGITDGHHLHIRNYIYKKMGGDWVFKPDLKIDTKTVIMQGPGYLDNGHGNVMVNKEKASGSWDKIIMPRAICLYCGAEYNNCQVKGVCKSCHETVKKEELEA